MFAFSLAGCGAGRLDCWVDNLGVTHGGDFLAICDLFAAIRTVGVAGVAGLGAGCFLGITKFCVLMCARRAAPDAADIVDGIAGLGGLRFGVGAIRIVKLRRSDRN